MHAAAAQGAFPRRGIVVFACFAIGIGIARNTSCVHPLVYLGAAVVCAVCSLWLQKTACKAALCAAVVLFGIGWFSFRIHHVPSDSLVRLLPEENRIALTFEGTLTRAPEQLVSSGTFAPFARRTTATRLDVDVRRAMAADGTWHDVAGNAIVFVSAKEVSLRVGQQVRVQGLARRADASPTNPGQPPYALLARQAHRVAIVNVPDAALVESIGSGVSVFGIAKRSQAMLRTRAMAWITHKESDTKEATYLQGRSLLASMLLGARDASTDDLRSVFARVGLAHLLSVSGLHLAFFAWLVLLALRVFGERPRLEPLLLAVLLLLYISVVPVRAPIVRASAMAIGFLAAEAFGRRYDRLNTLAWIALFVGLWRPMELFSVGYQLSFGIVAALLLCAEPVRNRLFGNAIGHDSVGGLRVAWNALTSWIAASIVAWCIATPILLHHVGVLSPLTAPATILCMPLFLLLMLVGYALTIVSVVVPAAASMLAAPVLWCAELFAGVVGQIESLPMATVYVPAVGGVWAIGAVAVAAVWLRDATLRSPRCMAAFALLLVWFYVEAATPRNPPSPNANTTSPAVLRIDSMDVGDGSCLLVRSGSESLLWDAGASSLTAGEFTLPRALRAIGARKVRTAVVTHSNLDHFSALPDLVRPLGIRRVWTTQIVLDAAAHDPEGVEAALLTELRAHGVRIEAMHAGEKRAFGDAEITFLWPTAEPDMSLDDNDHSLVARIEVETATGVQAALLTGDIERDAMEQLCAQPALLQASILESPHHGSAAHAYADDFIYAVNPDVVLQSTGPSRLDDPRMATARNGRVWLVTARDGTITAAIHADGSISTKTYKDTTKGATGKATRQRFSLLQDHFGSSEYGPCRVRESVRLATTETEKRP